MGIPTFFLFFAIANLSAKLILADGVTDRWAFVLLLFMLLVVCFLFLRHLPLSVNCDPQGFTLHMLLGQVHIDHRELIRLRSISADELPAMGMRVWGASLRLSKRHIAQIGVFRSKQFGIHRRYITSADNFLYIESLSGKLIISCPARARLLTYAQEVWHVKVEE